MKIHQHTKDVCVSCRPFVTMGAFDGVHKGHLEILTQMKLKAKKAGAETLVLIFFPHPRQVLEPLMQVTLNLLTSLEEKLVLFEKAGIDHLVILPFTKELSGLDYEEFVRVYLWEPLQMQGYIAGYDHGFGRGRAGGFEDLQKLGNDLGFVVSQVKPVHVNGAPVSSTRIREALEVGKVKEAEEMLGYSYRLKGKVVKGNQIGQGIGYPTANILSLDPEKMIPGQGVYAVWVKLEGEDYPGMMNIGNRPTIQGNGFSMEIHLFDFDKDIYGAQLEVTFLERIRNEQKFQNLEQLKQQLDKDQIHARNLLGIR